MEQLNEEQVQNQNMQDRLEQLLNLIDIEDAMVVAAFIQGLEAYKYHDHPEIIGPLLHMLTKSLANVVELNEQVESLHKSNEALANLIADKIEKEHSRRDK